MATSKPEYARRTKIMPPDEWKHRSYGAARGKSPVEGAAGSCGRSARSEEDSDPGDLLRRTTKPTAANVRRPKGYAPFLLGCAESAAPRFWNGWALRHQLLGA